MLSWVCVARAVTYYRVETEARGVILANGAASETFVDVVTRAAFDNYGEYLNLYGAERIIPGMDCLQVTAHRLLPQVIRHKGHARITVSPEQGYVMCWGLAEPK